MGWQFIKDRDFPLRWRWRLTEDVSGIVLRRSIISFIGLDEATADAANHGYGTAARAHEPPNDRTQ
jgi:hypothetical protein